MKCFYAFLCIATICRFCHSLESDDDELALDEDIYSFIEADEDLKRDLFLQTQSYASGENVPINDTSPEVIVEMMFNHNDQQDLKLLLSADRKVETNEISPKEDYDDLSDGLMKSLAQVFERYNASILLANSTLVVTKKSTSAGHFVILRIDGDIVVRIDDLHTAFPTLTSSDKSEIEDIVQRYNKSSPAANATQLMHFCELDDLHVIELDEIHQFVSDGYLDEHVLKDVRNGKLSADDAIKPLMTNKGFVLYQFPDKLSEMLEDERIPPYVAEALFSGTYSLGELKQMVYQDDIISKAFLPDRLRELLENRNPPTELKELLYCGHNHSTIVGLTMKNKTLVKSMMSDSMYYFYNLFRVPRNVILNMAMSGTTILALTCVMTSLGCTMTVKEIMVHVRRPKGVLIALVSQYGVMPAAAFALTQAFDLDVYPAIAVLICGCCPGGNLSNILAFALNGDMNLSILMTTCSSVLGLAMMPLLLFCYSRYIVPIDGAEIVPFGKIVLNIVLTILPVSIGIAIKHYRPTWTKVVMRFGAIMLLLCSITFSVMAGFLLGDRFFTFFPTSVVYCAAILPVTGYILGFVLARLVRENHKCSRTISVETGCQNVQLCGTVLKLAFDPVLIGAMMLLPIIYMLFQAGEATFLICLYRLYERICGKKKTPDDGDEFNFDDEDKKLEDSDSEIKKPDEDKTSQTAKNGKETKKSSMTSPQGENWPLVPSGIEDNFENAKENYV